jgi:integrase
MTTKSLGQAITIWGETRNIRNTKLVGLLKIALKVYVLPSLTNESVSELSPSNFSDFCYEINIIDLELKKVLEAFDEAFEARTTTGKVSTRTKGNYRSALGKFFTWLQTQDWYFEQSNISEPKFQPKIVLVKQIPSKTYNGKRIYGLKEEDLTAEIQLELKRYEEFWSQDSHTVNFIQLYFQQSLLSQSDRRTQRLRQAEEESSESTYFLTPVFHKTNRSTQDRRKEQILRFFGWCVNIEGYDIKELSLDLLTRKAFYQDYIDWLRQNRKCGVSAGIKVLEASISIAKYQTFQDSKKADWADIPLVEFLRSERNIFAALDKKEQPNIQEGKWEKKEISHQQAIEVVNYLYQAFALKRLASNGKGKKSSAREHLPTLIRNWQTYLIIKILVYAPVRQEEIRKLRIGSTLKLIEDSQGIVRYAVKIKEHKNAHISGKPRYYPLPQILTEDISTWINEIRPLAIDAPATLDSWLAFWDHSTKKISNLENSIQRAEAEETPDEKYCQSLRYKHRGIKNRLEAWETAKHNAKNCDHLFFALGKGHPKSFCFSYEKVHHGNISAKVSKAMGNATLALFGEARFLNPHGFRNIAAKHLRTIGKTGDKEAFSEFLGHSVEIDDDYADTITNDYDLIECVVDNWWQ